VQTGPAGRRAGLTCVALGCTVLNSGGYARIGALSLLVLRCAWPPS
jgi:hypothetical protein